MKMTSAQAGKLLKKLNEEHSSIIEKERKQSRFSASVGEDIEKVRPEYSFRETADRLLALEEEIRKVKHALNLFNSTCVIPEFGITVDDMLVLLPQLTSRQSRLGKMKLYLPRERHDSFKTNIVEYDYTNFDADEVAKDYMETTELLAKAQLALDIVNTTETFEIDI